MKRTAAILLGCAVAAMAQNFPTPTAPVLPDGISTVPYDPTGLRCSAATVMIRIPQGTQYTCQSGKMAAASSAALPSSVVQTILSNVYSAGTTQDFSSVLHFVVNHGPSAGKPATCGVGEIYFATDAADGQNWLFCTALNHWSAQAAGGTSFTLSTTGTSGPATFFGGVLNIPQYSGGASLFSSYQFGSTTPLTGSGLYLQTIFPSIFSLSQSGAGTSGSPYVDTVGLVNQTANYVWAAPNGSNGPPTFRLLVPQDVPRLNQDTTGNAGTASALQGTPTQCSPGNAPTGILPNGNATGCEAIGGGSAYSSLTQDGTTGQLTASKSINGPAAAAASGATVTIDLSTCQRCEETLTANTTISFSHQKAGLKFDVAVKQATVGGPFTVAYSGVSGSVCAADTDTTTPGVILQGFEVAADGTTIWATGCVNPTGTPTFIAGPTRTAASSPASGNYIVWFDSTNNTLQGKDSSGNLNSLVRTAPSATANQWVDFIATTGIPHTSQPAFSNLSGAASLSQLAAQAADTVVGNASGASAAPTAVALPTTGTNGCAGGSNGLTYNTTTHSYGCNTNHVTTADTGTVSTTMIAANAVTLAKLATQAADTALMNATGAAAPPTAVAMPSCTSGADLYNTTTHSWSCVSVATTVASGTAALGTAAIASGACATVVTSTATGVATTDAIAWTPNADITAVTGYVPSTSGGLAIYPYPTANAVNFKVCNPTSASITPGAAVTLNWRVGR